MNRMHKRAPFSIEPHLLLRRTGVVVEVAGTMLRARGVRARVGEHCVIKSLAYGRSIESEAEVIGVQDQDLLLMPFGGVQGLGVDAQVWSKGQPLLMPVGEGFLGRVIDARGVPIDDRGDIQGKTQQVDLQRAAPRPMSRRRIDQVFVTGVRSIDTLCTVGQGQRVGIFAPAGVGKSVLLGMLARESNCDVAVVALIGERGREVREFVEDCLGPAGQSKAIVIVATADAGPIERARAAFAATAMAEHFRDQGKRVLLLVDSLTRFARAQREIGLARGEPPTRRGYPPSLFAALPQLLERAGNAEIGTLTAFYTVLMEDEITPDPVAEEVRSLLDGHLVLSRRQAERGLYPALDSNASLSRLMSSLVDPWQRQAAARVRELLARRNEIDMLVQMGEYKRGQDVLSDESLDRAEAIDTLLRQSKDTAVEWTKGQEALSLASGIAADRLPAA
jgi:ATP synthase in type III secretion protein N